MFLSPRYLLSASAKIFDFGVFHSVQDLMIFLYILELCHGRWYVGTSKSPDERFKAHKQGRGTPWTQLYKPIREHSRIQLNCSEEDARFEEDKTVKKLMKDHGIANVRGGSYCQKELSEDQEISLQRELDHANNACLRCGRKGHFASKCFARSDVYGNSLSDSDSEDFYLQNGPVKGKSGKRNGPYETRCPPCDKGKGGKRNSYETCYRCGRSGHWANQCYARTNVNGTPLD